MRSKKFYWSSSRVNSANYCGMRYYLKYMLGKEELRLSAYVKGSFLHSLIENFWDRLGTPEEAAKKSSGKKYSDAKSFVDYARRKWQRIIIADEEAEQHIAWTYDNEKWVIRGNLGSICSPLFDYLSREGRPLFAELPFDFKIDGERFTGRIDEVRVINKQIVLTDYKSGKPWVGEMKLDFDPQLTLYNAGLCSLILFNPAIAQTLGLEGRIKEFMHGNRFTSLEILERFFMIEAMGINPEKVKTVPSSIYETRRAEEHFFELLKMVKSVRKRACEGDVYPERGKKCDLCGMKEECRKEIKNVNTDFFADKTGQGLLSLATPDYAKRTVSGNMERYQRPFRKPEQEANPSQRKFRFQYKKGGIRSGSSEPAITA